MNFLASRIKFWFSVINSLLWKGCMKKVQEITCTQMGRIVKLVSYWVLKAGMCKSRYFICLGTDNCPWSGLPVAINPKSLHAIDTGISFGLLNQLSALGVCPADFSCINQKGLSSFILCSSIRLLALITSLGECRVQQETEVLVWRHPVGQSTDTA